ncbi:MAG TPA: hypothetical protein VGO11_21570 [Chthoniobacteraceae bacterium]|jgi:hypothetical protein|nr:hypothetical protein [Chthoniobacteraceae bacterium]
MFNVRRICHTPAHCMKDIPVEEMVAISPEIHEAAVRVGCTHVSITGRIWPGGRIGGVPEEAARFTEYSWLKAAVIAGRAIFEETDPKAYAELLNAYGLGEEPYPESTREASESEAEQEVGAPASAERVELTAPVLTATKRELERQAEAEGISVAELLDWKFRPRLGR